MKPSFVAGANSLSPSLSAGQGDRTVPPALPSCRPSRSQSPAIALPAGGTITLRFPFFFAPLNPGSLIEAGVDRVTIVRQ